MTHEVVVGPAYVLRRGHPIGAAGSILTVKVLYELARIGWRYAWVTMCIGSGQGIAAIFERL